jgi:hypothetical protein
MGLHRALSKKRPAWFQFRLDIQLGVSTFISEEALAGTQLQAEEMIQFARERNIIQLEEEALRYGWCGVNPQPIQNHTSMDHRDPLAQHDVVTAKFTLPPHVWYSTSHIRENIQQPFCVEEAALMVPHVNGCECATCIYYEMRHDMQPPSRYVEETREWRDVGLDNGWLTFIQNNGYSSELRY